MMISVPTEKGKTMTECMMFPNDWAKFLEDYSFRDSEEVYTNGARLIPTFRVEQMMKHYLRTAVADKWIPVTERLPKPNKLVLCWWHSGDGEKEHFGFATFQSHGVWYVSNEGMPEVTHWMPLPEAPKEDV